MLIAGQKTGKELLELYESADIFVLPSLKEGHSLAMLEALAAGLPVVASDLPELRQPLASVVCSFKTRLPQAMQRH